MKSPKLIVSPGDVRSLARALLVVDAWVLCPAGSREGFSTRPFDLTMFEDQAHLAFVLNAAGQFVHNGLEEGSAAVVLIFKRHYEPGQRHKGVLLSASSLATPDDVQAFERWAFRDTPRLTVFLRDPQGMTLN
ncbi:hypothetical protein GCM10022631_10980 [Deinococcus rubellus]|uniref:hypothetical protein n=1 Tax=Deinococcus rubellus TaxID=1889240 RepID=UPI0031E688AB